MQTAQLLFIVRAQDFDTYESLARRHASDARIRVIFDRRQRNRRGGQAIAVDVERRKAERRSARADWKIGHLVSETGYR